MPPSQLKRLKASLREQGIVGSQPSKRQKKQASKNGSFRDKKTQRNAALQGIRDQFNPFEVKAPARGTKYEFTNSRTVGGRVVKGGAVRPGVSKGVGEENRRKTLLVEMQRRKKVGGITDRRFGENDPTMTLEEKALERFVREKQRGVKKESQFDLDDEEEDVQLTHFGESLSFDRADKTDDFNEPDLGVSDEDGHDVAEEHGSRKRRKLSGLGYSDENSTDEDSEMGSERPKTKQEVMKEVMAKSKLHKYERQQAKEDDDDLRAELDKGLPDLFALIRGSQPQAPSQRPQAGAGLDHGMNPDRAALLDGKDRSQADKEYDERLRQMQFDQRSKPTNPTKTEEERLSEEAQRLKELEEKRLRRMRGDEDSSDEEFDHIGQEAQGDDDIELDEAEILGIGSGISGEVEKQQLDVEDEDDFVIENDLVASDIDTSDGEHNSLPVSNDGSSEDEDLEFIHGLPSADSFRKDDTRHTKPQIESNNEDGDSNDLAYTYSCPQSHQDFRLITETIPIEKTTIVVQRIRALYHPKLHGDNKAKLEIFSAVLVDHISFLANQTTHPPFAVLEALIRHIHSLAKTFPEAVGRAFRSHLKSLHETRPNSPTPGDLIILTAIASIFPTSDHFHQVVTPAILCMARYMGQKIPHSLGDFAVGTYLETLCLHYQRLSKRYVPELVNYSLNVLYTLAPAKPTQILSCFPCYMQTSLSLVDATPERPEPLERKLSFWDIGHPKDSPEKANKELKISLLNTHIAFFDAMADLWASKSAFYEVFNPVSNVLRHLTSNACLSRLNTTTKSNAKRTLAKVQVLLQQAHLSRRPLKFHTHRPLAIKTSIPKFEESYNPDKHYDPDRDRADMSKLKSEHKRERKGALRELRKDANFIARENLKEKKERDTQYEKKYKRLVAEIQGEEGRESNIYEREKRMRKGKR